MRDRDHKLWQGADAVADVLRGAGYRPLQKADNPNARRTFDRIVAQVATDLASATHDLDSAFVEKLLAALDLDVEDLTAADLGEVYARVQRILPSPDRYIARVVPVFADQVERLVLASRATALSGKGKAGPLLPEDLAVLEHLQDAQAHYIRSALAVRNDQLFDKVRKVIDRAIDQGWRRADVARAVRAALDPEDVLSKQDAYYDVVAGAFVSNARTLGVLSRFRDAGVTQYQWESVLDEVTSDVCRFLHGTIFEVEQGLRVMQQMASNVDSVKEVAPWVRVGRDADGNRVLYTKSTGHRREIAQVVRSGVGNRDDQGQYRSIYDAQKLASVGICLPPAHGNCRSTILAVV